MRINPSRPRVNGLDENKGALTESKLPLSENKGATSESNRLITESKLNPGACFPSRLLPSESNRLITESKLKPGAPLS